MESCPAFWCEFVSRKKITRLPNLDVLRKKYISWELTYYFLFSWVFENVTGNQWLNHQWPNGSGPLLGFSLFSQAWWVFQCRWNKWSWQQHSLCTEICFPAFCSSAFCVSCGGFRPLGLVPRASPLPSWEGCGEQVCGWSQVEGLLGISNVFWAVLSPGAKSRLWILQF